MSRDVGRTISSTPSTCVERIRGAVAALKAQYGKPDAKYRDAHDQVTLEHTFHAGVYARTLRAPAGLVLANALIRVPTILIVSGDCTITDTENSVRVSGYQVLKGAPNRMCMVYTHEDTTFTMLYATDAKTVEEAEAEFADPQDELQH